MPLATPFVIDAGLTAIVQNYHNPDYTLIADAVMPRVNVGGETYKYDVYNTADMFTVPDTTIGRRSAPNQVEFGAQQKTGSVIDRGLDAPVPARDIEVAKTQRAQGNSSFDPEARAVEGVTSLVRLGREIRVAKVVQDADNYDADKVLSLSGSDQWSDPASEIIEMIQDGCDSTFIARPNIGVTDRRVLTFMSRHPAIVEAIAGTGAKRGIARKEEIAELFGLKEILVGESWLNSARSGRPANMQRTWGNSFALLYRNSEAQAKDGLPTWGFTAEWHVAAGNSAMIAGRMVDPNGGGLLGSVTMRAGEFAEEHVQAKSSGFLFQNVITEPS